MNIRDLMNILENIEKKDEQPEEKVEKDVEQPDTKDVKHHSKHHEKHHSKHHEKHHPKHHEKVVKKDSDDDVDDDEGDDEDKDEKKGVDEFKKYARDYGNGLFSIIPFNDISAAWSGGASSGPNMKLVDAINDLARQDSKVNKASFGWLGNISDRDIVSKRLLVMAFYNEHTGNMIKLTASGVDKDYDFGVGEFDKSQLKTVREIEKAVKNWLKSVPSYVPMRSTDPNDGYSKENEKWNDSESELLGLISNSGYADNKGPKSDVKVRDSGPSPWDNVPEELRKKYHEELRKDQYLDTIDEKMAFGDYKDREEYDELNREYHSITDKIIKSLGIDKYLNKGVTSKEKEKEQGVGREKR